MFPLLILPSPTSPLYLQAFVATGTNLSLQFFPANLLGDQRQVPTREYVDFERETGKVGQAQDTLTLTCVTLCPPCAGVRETTTDFNIRRRVAGKFALSHDFFLDSSDTFHRVKTDGEKNGETYIHVCSFTFCSSFSL